jgi:hypothetical protein
MSDYIWKVSSLICIPDLKGKLDYVTIANFTCSKQDGEYTGIVCNAAEFDVNSDKLNYVPYDKLTEDKVIEWIKDALGAETVTNFYLAIDEQIANKANPLTISPDFPWATAKV